MCSAKPHCCLLYDTLNLRYAVVRLCSTRRPTVTRQRTSQLAYAIDVCLLSLGSSCSRNCMEYRQSTTIIRYYSVVLLKTPMVSFKSHSCSMSHIFLEDTCTAPERGHASHGIVDCNDKSPAFTFLSGVRYHSIAPQQVTTCEF